MQSTVESLVSENENQNGENQSSAKNSVGENLNSFYHIIGDIIGSLDKQTLGNLSILENKINSGDVICIKDIDLLVKQPIKLVIGRVNGLRKIVKSLQSQIQEAVNQKTV